MRLSCSWRACSGGMRTWASFPNPVFTPYIVSPRATAASTALRDCCTAASALASSATGALWRATATTSAIEREWPSNVTGFAMGTKAKAPEWLLRPLRRLDLTRTAYFEPETPVPVKAPEWSQQPLRRFSRSEEHTSELQSRLHLVCRL